MGSDGMDDMMGGILNQNKDDQDLVVAQLINELNNIKET
jgi:hypothetical protein